MSRIATIVQSTPYSRSLDRKQDAHIQQSNQISSYWCLNSEAHRLPEKEISLAP
jgi:hypothetical protein